MSCRPPRSRSQPAFVNFSFWFSLSHTSTKTAKTKNFLSSAAEYICFAPNAASFHILLDELENLKRWSSWFAFIFLQSCTGQRMLQVWRGWGRNLPVWPAVIGLVEEHWNRQALESCMHLPKENWERRKGHDFCVHHILPWFLLMLHLPKQSCSLVTHFVDESCTLLKSVRVRKHMFNCYNFRTPEIC